MNEYYQGRIDENEENMPTNLNKDKLSEIQKQLNGSFEKDICDLVNIQMENNCDKLNYNTIGHIEDDGYDIDI